MKESFADVAVDLPVEGLFTYAIPQTLESQVTLGKRVLVPFGKRTVTGYVTGVKKESDIEGVKDILDVLDDTPIFDEKRLKFYRWLSSYYFAPPGNVLSLTHPAGANIRSQRFFFITERGRNLVNDKDGLSREILEAVNAPGLRGGGGSVGGVGLSLTALLKRFRKRPIHSTLQRLKKEGLMTEEIRLKGGSKPKTEKILALTEPARALPEELSGKRAPLQAKLYNYLLEKGESPMGEAKKRLGNIGQAAKRLTLMGLITISERTVARDPLSDVVPRASDHEPNEAQRAAIERVVSSMAERRFSPFLLYGVTGSGKTLVYLKVLEEVLRAGRKALFLVPEIALTPWPIAYLKEKFPGRVAVSHSALSPGERFDEWKRALSGTVDIVVGARSALFSPLKDLSLIIVDEEHDPSYKQEEGVRYNGRDAALMLGKTLGITVLLGSATPSVETFYNSEIGRIERLALKKRVEERAMPAVEIMDMRKSKGVILSERLKGLMEEAFRDGHQTLLFLNRRGFSGSLICRDCGHGFMCLNCSVTLAVHKGPGKLICHYCDFSIPIPDECPECRGIRLVDPGPGTEKVAEEVGALFPGKNVLRMDRDTTRQKGSVRSIIDAFEDRKADVLVGTQMVSKGHHFPGITIVGIISGDTSLNIPDFRSSERTFQLVTQAAGRAGRGVAAGTVVIQTLNPAHYCFKAASSHSYDGFFAEEIELRRELSYPPFTRLCSLRLDGLSSERTTSAAFTLRASAEALLKKNQRDIRLLGPAPALIARLKGRHRWQMLVKGADFKELHAFVKRLRHDFHSRRQAGITLTVDMDPMTVV